MHTTTYTLRFDAADLLAGLRDASDAELDELPFGVIGFDGDGRIVRYNRFESREARFERSTVMGQHVFVELAPCLNNYLVAGRFDEAREAGEPLDATLPYVLTFRMRPTRVRMRLLSQAGDPVRYVLVDRTPGGQS